MDTFRLIDANFNRCREGLRVIEEFSRFICNDSKLSLQIKNFRHTLQKFENSYGLNSLRARDTNNDIGTNITVVSETKRANINNVLTASFKRIQEALRVLEEYSKIDKPNIAKGLEDLRYKSYQLEKEISLPFSKQCRLSSAKLYALITTDLCFHSPEKTAELCLKGGVDIIQLREKQLHDKGFLKIAKAVKKVLLGSNTILIINDNIPIAQAIDADGVHLGQDDLPQKIVSKILGEDKIIGRSTHSVAQALKAQKEGADYIGVGPVWETNTKKHRRAVGLELIKNVAQQTTLPFFPIGSIKTENAKSVLQVGATRLAVCTGITNTKNVTARCKAFNKILK